uniref:Ig-like domain-containing protein n=1 Tax=Arion vulgaris TaxID=1028688 RepID=A0A0B6ZUZ6_9EUPU
MFVCLLCVGYLFLQTFRSGVTGQRIDLHPFNNSLTRTNCTDGNVVIEGEQIVLTALLDASQTDPNVWPLDEINLLDFDKGKIICQINITRDGCQGFRPGLCGYCDSQDNSYYHLIFNITAVLTWQDVFCSWVGSTVSFNSYPISVDVAGYPYSTMTLEYRNIYYVQDISKYTFTEQLYMASLDYLIRNGGRTSNTTWRFSTDSTDEETDNPYEFFNVSFWNTHFDDVMDISFQDPCSRNWSFTIPVTYVSDTVCDLPVITRSNSFGTLVTVVCQLTSFQTLITSRCDLRMINTLNTGVDGDVVRSGDSWTCVLNITDIYSDLNPDANVYIFFTYDIDTQFTNGTELLPKVVKFTVNSLTSVIVEEGTNINFECSVYGNPSATAVISGPVTGREQENISNSRRIKYTLKDAQCQDSGSYTCKGVSRFGTTPMELQYRVNVSVICPIAIKSHLPANKDRKFYFDINTDVMVTLEVSGYPAPTHFDLRAQQQGSSLTNVSQDKYVIKYQALTPSLSIINLFIPRGESVVAQAYVFTITTDFNKSTDFQFEILELVSEESQSPWLYAFIAVICLLGVFIVIVIIICVVKYCIKKKDGESKFDDIIHNTSTAATPVDIRNASQNNPYKLELSPTKHPDSTTDIGSSTSPSVSAVEDDIYENVASESLYEIPS